MTQEQSYPPDDNFRRLVFGAEIGTPKKRERSMNKIFLAAPFAAATLMGCGAPSPQTRDRAPELVSAAELQEAQSLIYNGDAADWREARFGIKRAYALSSAIAIFEIVQPGSGDIRSPQLFQARNEIATAMTVCMDTRTRLAEDAASLADISAACANQMLESARSTR